MNHPLSKKECILLLILALFLLGVLYYYVFYQPLQANLLATEIAVADTQDAIALEQARAAHLAQMTAQLAALDPDAVVEVPLYDNAQQVIAALNSILASSVEYSLDFSPVVIEEQVVRRSIQMNFICRNYGDARAILSDLYACRYRCLIGNLALSAPGGPLASVGLADGALSVSLTASFFELMP